MERCQLEIDCSRISLHEENGEIVLRIAGSLKIEGGDNQIVQLVNAHLIEALEAKYAELFKSKIVKPVVPPPSMVQVVQVQPVAQVGQAAQREERESDTISQSSNNSKPPPAIFTNRSTEPAPTYQQQPNTRKNIFNTLVNAQPPPPPQHSHPQQNPIFTSNQHRVFPNSLPVHPDTNVFLNTQQTAPSLFQPEAPKPIPTRSSRHDSKPRIRLA